MRKGRRSIRLRGYDYASPGAYFVTIVTHGRICHFGNVGDGRVHLSAAGEMVDGMWHTLPDRFPTIRTDAFVVMPNHIHGILLLGAARAGDRAAGGPRDDGASIGPPDDGASIGPRDQKGASTRDAPTDAVRAGLVPAHPKSAHPKSAHSKSAHPKSAHSKSAHPKSAHPESGHPKSTHSKSAPAPTLGDIVGAFKSLTTNAYIRGVRQHGWPPFDRRLWHRNYYERIVRDEDELGRIRLYIAQNPARWERDRER